MKKILITGISGFIGKSLIKTLSKLGRPVKGTVRSNESILIDNEIKGISTGDISLKTNWKDILADIECIVHCAGRAHVMKETQKDALKIYRSVNVDATKQLAEQAAEAKVKRFIFLSSIKVNGEDTYYKDNISKDKKKNIFTNNNITNPNDSYAISKLEAENVLWEISSRTGLGITVVRLPLVYGFGAKGNLYKLLKLVESGIPLPFKMVKNQRSMIGIDNLIDLLIRCVDHPEAVGKTFLVSDGEDLSTPDLINHIANSMGYKARLFPFPFFLLNFLGSIIGKKKEIDRLIGSLQIDSTYTQKVLNWKPPLSVKEGISRMIKGK